VAKLTDAERAEIRAAFARLAEIQADATIAKLEAANTQVTIDVPGDPWHHFGGGYDA